MSIHYHKPDYKCPRCQAFFLPYKIGIKCPNCDMTVEDKDTKEYLDVINSITDSMELHKKIHGTYFPGAWLTSNFMDHVQDIIYQIFDAMEEVKPENEKEYLMDLLENKIGWGDHLYSKKHLIDITSEVFKIYKSENFSEIKFNPPKPPTKWEQIKRWFYKFLP